MATTSSKKRSAKPRARRANGGGVPNGMPQDVDIMMTSDGEAQPTLNPENNTIEQKTADGMISIQFAPEPETKKDRHFDDNIAEILAESSEGQMILGRIAETQLEAIEMDSRDCSEWLQERADGLDLLGLKVKKPGTGNVGSSATAVAGQSTVQDSILSEACDQFQANAYAELCPSDGPVKGKVVGEETDVADQLAQELEDDFNFYLASNAPGTAKEYYPDTRRMLWWTGYASGTFKKVYRCPLRERPVSESVDGADLIVPSNATDLSNAARITHRINMGTVTMKQMQLQGAYRDVSLTAPTPMPSVLTQKEGTVTGTNPNPTRIEDQDYTIYEVYCSLDIDGFEHKRKGKVTGLPVPYRVVIDKDSRTVLEIRRNWKPPAEDEDQDALPVAKIPFVFFPYATGLGFYGTGLLHRLGNSTMALTAMLRISIDSGMFANFPGFLYAKPMGRQLQNEFRVPPGGGAPVDVSTVGGNINNAVMALPYKPVDGGFIALQAQTRENAMRYGNMANTGVAEGKQAAPVGTTLALIEQNTRVEGGVHRALHAAQAEEFQLLKELFRDDPEALWRGNKRPAFGGARTEAERAARLERFKRALEDCDIVPASDPNVSSKMHRMGKGQALFQAATTSPGWNLPEVYKEWGQMMQISNIERFIAPPQQGDQPNPAMLKLAIDKQNADTKAQQVALQHQTNQDKIKSQEQIEAAKIGQAHAAAMANGGPVEPPPPDPQQDRALAIKERQVGISEQKLHLDAANAHAERHSKAELKGLEIAARLATHPESQPVVNSEIDALQPFMQAPESRSAGGMGAKHGGPVMPEETEQQRTIKLARAIAQALQERGHSYIN